MKLLWLALKGLLSSILVAIAVAMLLLRPLTLEPSTLVLSSACLFIAALPWIDFSKPSRAIGLASLVLSFVFLKISSGLVAGSGVFPKVCDGRRKAFCNFENLLYEVGGKYLAAAPVFALATLLFVGGVVLVVRVTRTRSSL
jgi:hypothetical protein